MTSSEVRMGAFFSLSSASVTSLVGLPLGFVFTSCFGFLSLSTPLSTNGTLLEAELPLACEFLHLSPKRHFP